MVAVFVLLHSVCRAPQGRQGEHEESHGEIDMLSSILDAGNMGMARYIGCGCGYVSVLCWGGGV